MLQKRGVIATSILLLAWSLAGCVMPQGDETDPPVPDQSEDSRAWATIQEFINENGDPCGLSREQGFEPGPMIYEDLASLVNNSDSVVIGQVESNSVEEPADHTIAGRLLTTFSVEEVLVGQPSETIVVDKGERVMVSSPDLVRVTGSEHDFCEPGRYLLFLARSSDPAVMLLGDQSWVGIAIDHFDVAEGNGIFDSYTSLKQVADDVRSIYQQQGGAGIQRGQLLCDSLRASKLVLDPVVCPGEAFEPIQAVQDAVKIAVDVSIPGPSPLVSHNYEFDRSSEAFIAFMDALGGSFPVTGFEPEPNDTLRVTFTMPDGSERPQIAWTYSPESRVVRMWPHSGQFQAPEAFGQAISAYIQ